MGMGVGQASTPKRVRKVYRTLRRTTGGSGEFQRDARRASALWAFNWNESGLTGLRYGLALRVAHVGRSIIKLVGCTCIPPESFVNFQRELLRGRMSIRAEEFSWQTDSGAPDSPTFDIYIYIYIYMYQPWLAPPPPPLAMVMVPLPPPCGCGWVGAWETL